MGLFFVFFSRANCCFVMNLQSRASEELSSTAAGGCEQENDRSYQQKWGLHVKAAAPLLWKSSVRPLGFFCLFFFKSAHVLKGNCPFLLFFQGRDGNRIVLAIEMDST